MADTDLSDARLQVEFEEWAVDYVKGMDSRGAYTSPYTQIAWTAWQASAVTIARRIASRPQQGNFAEAVKMLQDLANIVGGAAVDAGSEARAIKFHNAVMKIDAVASALSRAGNGNLQQAAQAFIDDLRRRYPGEAFRCQHVQAIADALPAAPHPEQEQP